MSDQLPKLSKTYASGINAPTKKYSPQVEAALEKPHLALLINGDWLPILPGMILAIVKSRSQVDGIAPYILTKVNAKPLKEYIDLVAWSTNLATSRKLRLGAKYGGTYASAINDADQTVDAAIAATKAGQDDDR